MAQFVSERISQHERHSLQNLMWDKVPQKEHSCLSLLVSRNRKGICTKSIRPTHFQTLYGLNMIWPVRQFFRLVRKYLGNKYCTWTIKDEQQTSSACLSDVHICLSCIYNIHSSNGQLTTMEKYLGSEPHCTLIEETTNKWSPTYPVDA